VPESKFDLRTHYDLDKLEDAIYDKNQYDLIKGVQNILVTAYKAVGLDGYSKIYTHEKKDSLLYQIGKTTKIKEADEDRNKECSFGINLGTLEWCSDWIGCNTRDYKILIAQFKVKDIAAIPYRANGKLRVWRCKIIGERTDIYKVICID